MKVTHHYQKFFKKGQETNWGSGGLIQPETATSAGYGEGKQSDQ